MNKPRQETPAIAAELDELYRLINRRHAATVDVWDADLWLLNTPAGVLDLKTGELRKHDPSWPNALNPPAANPHSRR